MPHFEPLTDQQLLDVCNLRQSSQQAEDALSQGMDKLQQTLAQSMVSDSAAAGSFRPQMAEAVDKLDSLENFVNQVILMFTWFFFFATIPFSCKYVLSVLIFIILTLVVEETKAKVQNQILATV